MAHYVNGLSALSGCCGYIPGRDSICLSLALVGILCLAAAMAIVFRADEDAAAPVVIDE